MITQRAALLGFVAFCFYLIAVVNVLDSYYYALTWLALGILAASLGIAFLSLIGLECQLDIKRSRAAASLGNDHSVGPLISIAMQNSGTLNKTGIILELQLRDAKDVLTSHRFIIEAVPSGTSIESDLPLSHLQRGKYRLEDVRLRGSDVLGLFRIQKRVILGDKKNREIIVGPPILRGEKAGRGGGGAIPSFSRRAIQSGHGDELRGTRPYAAGDDLRHVHWKSTARIGELVVKEFEQTGREKVLVVWDGAQSTSWGSGEFNSTEWSLILCATICNSLLSSGTPCDFARLDNTPLLVEAHNMPGNELPAALTDAMASSLPARVKGLDISLQTLPQLYGHNYSTVVIVTASMGIDVRQAALAWRVRGAHVQVLLVDGASLAARTPQRRSRARAARPLVQTSGAQTIPLSAENYEMQMKSIRETGAEVVRVVSTENFPSLDLRRAMQTAFEPNVSTLRAYEANS